MASDTTTTVAANAHRRGYAAQNIWIQTSRMAYRKSDFTDTNDDADRVGFDDSSVKELRHLAAQHGSALALCYTGRMRLTRRSRTDLARTFGVLVALSVVGTACVRLDSPNDSFDFVGERNASGASGQAANVSSAGTNATNIAAFGAMGGAARSGSGGTTAVVAAGGSVGATSLSMAGTTLTGKGGVQTSGGQSNSGGPSVGGVINATAGTTGNACWDASGMRGLGCFSCTPKDVFGFENACTSAACVVFDNSKRLPKLSVDGKLPALAPSISSTGGSSSTLGSGSFAGSGGKASSTSMGGAAAGSLALAPARAGATSTEPALNSCDELAAKGKVVYVVGSSAAKPFLQQIAQQLASQSVFIVYVASGSCVGIDAVLNRTLIRTGAAPLPATSASYWDSPSSNGRSCSIAAGGVLADIGISDVFAQTCPGFELSSLEAQQVKDAHGPIQAMTFVVPATSRYSEVSAQAAYFVFGFGKDGGVLDPTGAQTIWNDESLLFIRSASSGTQAMLTAAIGVPPERWKGKTNSSSDALVSALLETLPNAESADKSMGILAADYLESKNLRAQLRILAFQDTNQSCAVYPDSTATARDKRNVRDGHYPIWGPLHLLYRIDASGSPDNATSRQEILDILGYFSGSKALPNGVRLMDVYAQSGLVPECAMRVTRTKDGGNLSPYAPVNPCSCLFELTTTGATSCKPCTVQGDCAANQSCSMGYCEQL